MHTATPHRSPLTVGEVVVATSIAVQQKGSGEAAHLVIAVKHSLTCADIRISACVHGTFHT